MTFPLKSLLSATTALCMMPGSMALAQEAAGQPDGTIIVTARRIQERLQDVPISITVYDQEQLTRKNISNSSDLAIYTPSLSTNNVSGSLNTNFSIRGFVQELSTPPSVGVYFADVVAPRGASSQVSVGDGAGPGSFFDLQNVQVLKGPQGTLFGRNTTGGAILLVPQKPTGAFGGYVEGSYGNYNMKRVQAALNAPLGEHARLRIAGEFQDRDGYLKNTGNQGPPRFNDLHYYALRGSLVVDITPDLENYVIASYTNVDQTGDLQKLITNLPGGFLGPVARGQVDRHAGEGFFTVQSPGRRAAAEQTQWQIINTTTYLASDDLTIKNIISYAQLKQQITSPYFGTEFMLNDLNPLIPRGVEVGFSTSLPTPTGDNAHQSTFSEELQFQGRSLGGTLDWQAGAYLEASNPLGDSGAQSNNLLSCPDLIAFCANPLGIGGTTRNRSRTRFRNVGVYSQATYSLTEKLKVTGGIRYTWDRTTAKGQQFSLLYPQGFIPGIPIGVVCGDPVTTADDCRKNFTAKSDAPTWLIGLDYKPDDDILLYGKYARGYRTGGVQLQVPAEFAVFNPEKVELYELGFKSSFQGSVRGTLNIAAFYNDFSDQQIGITLNPRNPGLPTATGAFNAGKSRIYGLEVDATLRPFDGMNISAGYAYLNTKIKSIDTFTASANSQYDVLAAARPGDRLTFSPKHKLSTTATYTLPLAAPVGEVSLGVTYTYTSPQLSGYSIRNANSIVAGYSVLGSRNLFDLNVNWKGMGGSPVDALLFVNNVTNEKYYNYLLPLPALGFVLGTVGQPRMYGIRLKYSFGS